MSSRPIFSPSELAAFERAYERRVAAEWFRSSHPEYAAVTARVAALLDADRNASLTECPPPPVPEPQLSAEQVAGMDDMGSIE